MRITAYEHAGIRVTDRRRSVRFYEALGFREVADLPEHRANEMETLAGVRLNLIFNGTARPGAANVLQDEPARWPGITHVAFIVDSLDALLDLLAHHGIPVTEGPLVIAGRRRTLFIRDPDGTVLEFNEMLGASEPT